MGWGGWQLGAATGVGDDAGGNDGRGRGRGRQGGRPGVQEDGVGPAATVIGHNMTAGGSISWVKEGWLTHQFCPIFVQFL